MCERQQQATVSPSIESLLKHVDLAQVQIHISQSPVTQEQTQSDLET